MKTYVQFIEAHQFTGNVQELRDFAGDLNVIEAKDELLVIENTTTGKGKWRVTQGDFVVKTRVGFDVYKEDAFNEYFDEVTTEDVFIEETKNAPDENVTSKLVDEVEKAKEDLATDEPAAKNSRKAKTDESKK